jgi:hypothetical protein
MSYYNNAKEKINGKYLFDRSLVKVNRKPYKVYLFQYKQGGSEILYNSTVDKENALVNPSKFPYINLRLSPYGSLMRNNTHHTIFQADIKFTYDIINNTLEKKSCNNTFKLLGVVIIDNKRLYKLEVINNDCKKYNYRVQEGEDLIKIARNKMIGEYKILELNPNISYYDDVKPGDIITIPNYYSKSIILYIDTKTYLPYLIKVYDDKGLYESYKLEDLKINVNFNKNEFNEDYINYGF